MSSLVTLELANERIETDLSDLVLQKLIDDADGEVVKRFGPHAVDGPVVEKIEGGGPRIFLARPAASITSVVERRWLRGIATPVTLAANDYQVWGQGRSLERLVSGSNAWWEWGEDVTVTYQPVSDDAQRTRVILDLVQLQVQYDGMDNSRVGDVMTKVRDYNMEREDILRTLQSRHGLLLA